MICERFADFLKHFLGEENTKLSTFLKRHLLIGNTIDKGLVNSVYEDKRYYRILKINIVCGFLVAFALHADIFTILNHLDEPEKAITWNGYQLEILRFRINYFEKEVLVDYQSLHWYLLGCLMTGFFISFGSKVWHDLLDLLLEVKNTRRKLNDKRTYELTDNIENFDLFINSPESKLAVTANEKHHDQIAAIDGVTAVGPGFMTTPEGEIGCLEVHFNKQSAMQSIPSEVKIYLGTMAVPVPVNKIYTGDTVLQAGISGAGNLTANESNRTNWGTIGCIVKKKGNSTDRYILSCYHVLTANKDYSQQDVKKNILVRENSKQGIPELKVAVLTEGVRTVQLDAAIAIIKESPEDYSNKLILNPKKIRNITALDAKDKHQVELFSAVRNVQLNGIVHNDTWKKEFPYPDGNWELSDLLVLTIKTGNNYRPLSVKGDSGALVLDKEGSALGIVVGCDECFTYAIKMTHIEQHFKIELI